MADQARNIKVVAFSKRPMAAVICSIVAGAALGAVAGLPGVVSGLVFGALLGFVTEGVLAKEEAKQSLRSRELDDILAEDVRVPFVTDTRSDDAGEGEIEPESSDLPSGAAWVDEWLTPIPPAIR